DSHRVRIVIDRQPVTKNQRIGIGFAYRLGSRAVILLGYDGRPLPHNLDALAAWAELGFGAALKQFAERLNIRRRHKVFDEALPVIRVALSQQPDQALFGEVLRRIRSENRKE